MLLPISIIEFRALPIWISIPLCALPLLWVPLLLLWLLLLLFWPLLLLPWISLPLWRLDLLRWLGLGLLIGRGGEFIYFQF